MKKQLLTDWFPPTDKPPHVGWWHTGKGSSNPKINKEYEAFYNFWWDGEVWLWGPIGFKMDYQNRWWRGLREEAK